MKGLKVFEKMKSLLFRDNCDEEEHDQDEEEEVQRLVKKYSKESVYYDCIFGRMDLPLSEVEMMKHNIYINVLYTLEYYFWKKYQHPIVVVAANANANNHSQKDFRTFFKVVILKQMEYVLEEEFRYFFDIMSD